MSMLGPTKTGQKGCGTQNLAAARLDNFWRRTVWLVWYDIHCSQAVAHLQACSTLHMSDLVMVGRYTLCLCKEQEHGQSVAPAACRSKSSSLLLFGLGSEKLPLSLRQAASFLQCSLQI